MKCLIVIDVIYGLSVYCKNEADKSPKATHEKYCCIMIPRKRTVEQEGCDKY